MPKPWPVEKQPTSDSLQPGKGRVPPRNDSSGSGSGKVKRYKFSHDSYSPQNRNLIKTVRELKDTMTQVKQLPTLLQKEKQRTLEQILNMQLKKKKEPVLVFEPEQRESDGEKFHSEHDFSGSEDEKKEEQESAEDEETLRI